MTTTNSSKCLREIEPLTFDGQSYNHTFDTTTVNGEEKLTAIYCEECGAKWIRAWVANSPYPLG